MMGICREGETITLKIMSTLIGSYMRIIPHVDATLVVDIKEDIFYLIRNTGKLDRENNGIYDVILVGKLDRLIKLLISGSLGLEN